MSETIRIGDIKLAVERSALGRGGQGEARKAQLPGDSAATLVLKSLPRSAAAPARTRALTDLRLPLLSPYLAGPLVCEDKACGNIRHLAPLAPGVPLDQDRARTFPELVELAHGLACQWTLCEEQGIAHGDIALSNVLVADDGAATLIDFDNAVLPGAPPPEMAGQNPMLAPEIRTRRAGATLETDRFAWAVLFNMILLGRHPADQATNPAELERLMTSNHWPERKRKAAAGDTPVTALGPALPALFDRAFSKDPAARPTADAWRRALHAGVNALWIHTPSGQNGACGQAFIANETTTLCPWCAEAITIEPTAPRLTILIPATGAKFRAMLEDGQTITLGRANLGGASASVSSRHLQITPRGDKLLFRHIGSNPTLIHTRGQWFRLADAWIDQAELAGTGLDLRLADLDVTIRLA